MNASAPPKDRESGTGVRAYKEIEPLGERDADLVNAAQRCLMTALDHSHAGKIMLLADDGSLDGRGPVLELPPAALRVIARVLGMMGERKPLILIPRDHELTTQEAASMLRVSRPFVIKEIEANRLACHRVGSHRRIAYTEVIRYRDAMKADQQQALKALAEEAQDLGLGYN